MAYKVAIVCNNGKLFMNSKEFHTIGSAVDCMIKTQRLLDVKMVLEDEYGKIILTKGVKAK